MTDPGGMGALFGGLMEKSDPGAVIEASIGFDFRRFYGEQSLVDAMWTGLLERIGRNRGFFRFLAASPSWGTPS